MITVREYIGSIRRITGALERSRITTTILDAHHKQLYQGLLDLIPTDLLDMEALRESYITGVGIEIYVPFISREIKEIETV